ncbi:phosphatase PAP2 family protein [Paenibacillus sp. CAU 1782]
MKIKIHFNVAPAICTVCIISFGLIGVFISNEKVAHFDQNLISFIQGLEHPTITRIMKVFTFIGSGVPVGVITAISILFLYKVLHHRVELVLLMGVIIGSALLNPVLKEIFHRARPMIHRIIEENGFSYPSGHSMAAFSLYGALTYLLLRHIKSSSGRTLLLIISGIMILLIGLSRIYLGVHYPTDVLGGFLASGGWLAIAIWFFQRRYRKQSGNTV